MNLGKVIAAVGVAAAAVALTAGTASATPADSSCTGVACYWWGTSWTGSSVGVAGNYYDFANPAVYFRSPYQGQNSRMWNNSASAANYYTNIYGCVYYNQGYTGPFVQLPPFGVNGWALADLGPVKNDNRSQVAC